MVLNLRTLVAALRLSVEHGVCRSTNCPKALSSLPRKKDPSFSDAAYHLRFYSTSSAVKRSKPKSLPDLKDTKVEGPRRSLLHPPKPPPSVWQLYFTDWLQRLRYYNKPKKLNVAHEAKEAAISYSRLSDDDKESLKSRADVYKEQYDTELADWKRSLTPADIEHENAFRTAQRKSGKSRRKNIPDPNSPKRPMSAYLYFLQHVRADESMSSNIFGDITESTRQSVLAAAKWRSMTDEEKQPYFDQADSDKLRYEAEKKVYEESTWQSGLSVFYYSKEHTSQTEENMSTKQHLKL